MIDFNCPNCGEPMSVPSCLAGQTEVCPQCGACPTVPSPSGAPPVLNVVDAPTPSSARVPPVIAPPVIRPALAGQGPAGRARWADWFRRNRTQAIAGGMAILLVLFLVLLLWFTFFYQPPIKVAVEEAPAVCIERIRRDSRVRRAVGVPMVIGPVRRRESSRIVFGGDGSHASDFEKADVIRTTEFEFKVSGPSAWGRALIRHTGGEVRLLRVTVYGERTELIVFVDADGVLRE